MKFNKHIDRNMKVKDMFLPDRFGLFSIRTGEYVGYEEPDLFTQEEPEPLPEPEKIPENQLKLNF